MARSRKLPSLQFYPGDWMRDPRVRDLSLSARGVWIDLICMAFEMPRRGVFRAENGAPLSLKTLQSMAPKSRASHIRELVEKGVLKVAKRSGTFYCKRLLRDELSRQRLLRTKRLSRCRLHGTRDGSVAASRARSSSSSTSITKSTNVLSSGAANCSNGSTARSAAVPEPPKTPTRDLVWDAVIVEWFPSGVGPSERSRVGRIVRELRAKGIGDDAAVSAR